MASHPRSLPAYGLPPAGVRLPDATAVGAVHLAVADLSRSLDYYDAVLGLQAVDRTADRARLVPRGGGEALVHLKATPGVRPAPRSGANGLFHFAVLLPSRPDLGRFLSHLTAYRVPYGASDHLVSEAIYLRDPDGLGIEVYADRPRQTWRAVDRELVMATDPLDVAAVMAAGAGGSWQGAPAGTTMGHVHLHVGDIDDARRFYQDALGFDVTVSRYPGALFFSAGGYHHHLGTNVWGSRANATDEHARLLQWELRVPADHLEVVAGQSRELGFAATRDGGGLALADPWGTRVALGG